MEEWLVDETGEFIQKVQFLEATVGPQIENIWTCYECGTEAQVEE